MTAHDWQIYLLAIDLFAVTALILGFGSFAKEGHGERLFPLLLLVIGCSTSLITSLTGFAHAPLLISGLEVWNTFCLVWALTGSTAHLPSLWREMLPLGGAAAIMLSFLVLLPIWPAPPQLHSLLIASLGAPLIYLTQSRLRPLYLTPPLLISLANVLSLGEFTQLAWLLTLLAYAVFIAAMHWAGLQIYQDSLSTYQEQQHLTEIQAQEIADRNREEQLLLEAYNLICSIPSLNQAMEHIVRAMARLVHVDQAAIFMLDVKALGQAHVVTVYSPERPVHITSRDEMIFTLDDCPVMQEVIENQQQSLLPRHDQDCLDALYGLWKETRTGPTLIQPLALQGRPVGVLVLGNPVSPRAIAERDARLCQALAPQIALMVEQRRRYLELELQAEAMAASVQEQMGDTADLEPELVAAMAPKPEENPPLPAWLNEFSPPPERVPQNSGTAAVGSGLKPDLPPLLVTPRPEVIMPAVSPAVLSPVGHNDKYHAVFEAIGDGVIVADTTGRVELVNKTAERLLGQSRRTLIGRPIGTIYGQIDSGEPIENLIMAFSRRNQPLPTFIENKDHAIQGRLIPWRNDQHEWLGIIGVFRDVTREMKADQARDDFVIALSHELRAPLTTVKGYTELITQGALGEYTPEQLRLQRLILSSAERMVEVLDNAIQITTEHRQRTLARFDEVDVNKVINEALRESAPLAQVRGLKLMRETKGDLPTIAADRRHLRRILDNLLSNACRFTPPNGRVTLRAWTQPARENKMPVPHLLISVADSGLGIPKEEFERIFIPFYQLKNQKVDEESVLGMVLAVVKDLVELHNGRVWVESTVGVGSMFQVALPISQEM